MRTFAAIVAGVFVGIVTAFGGEALVSGADHPPAQERTVTVLPSSEPTREPAAERAVVLVASPRGLPLDLGERLLNLSGVSAISRVAAHVEWLDKTVSSTGAVLDAPGGGRAIPFEVAGVDPGSFAPFMQPSDRSRLLALRKGEILIARSEASLRRGAEGMRLHFGSGVRTVVGVLSDQSTGGYEGLVRKDDLGPGGRLDEFILVLVDSIDRRPMIDRRLSRWLSDRPFRTRLAGETPYMRYGDSVLPQMIIKKTFGEFSATPKDNGFIDIDPDWVRNNIVQRSVPLLGEVTCHRAIVRQLRGALDEVVSAGLSFLVDSAQYAGCFGARFVNADPSGRLSHHSWGIAFDINVSTNSFGSAPHQDRRLVRIIERWGFTWGGRWLIPDGMHFEWVGSQ